MWLKISALYGASAKASIWHSSVENTTEMTQLIHDEKYKLEVKLKAANTFNINRGSWYKDDFVKPNCSMSEGAMFTKESFFGKNGSLQLVPSSFLIIYKPKITLTVDYKIYETKFKTKVAARTLFSFFGLSMNGSVDASKEMVSQGEVTTEFGNNEFAKPQIIGVTSMKHYMW